MPKTIKFSEKEWEVVSELLKQERGNLRPEIRHTDSLTVHDELQNRLETVNAILARTDAEPAKAAPAR
jgi:hypothetical protein